MPMSALCVMFAFAGHPIPSAVVALPAVLLLVVGLGKWRPGDKP